MWAVFFLPDRPLKKITSHFWHRRVKISPSQILTRIFDKKIAEPLLEVRQLKLNLYLINMILTQIYADRLLSEFKSELLAFKRTKVCSIYAMLNAYVWHAALNDGRISRGRDNKRHFDFTNIAEFFRTDRQVSSPITGIKDYVKKHWSGLTYTDRECLTNLRKFISQRFKLFTLEDRTEIWEDALNRHRIPNPCGEFSMLRVILLARACEEHLLSYCGMELEAMQLNVETAGNGTYEYDRIEDKSFPKHKAYTLALVGKAAGLWTDSEQIHPDLIPMIELEGLRMQAEDQFDDTDFGDRTEEEVLEEEWLPVTEIETVTSKSGVTTVVERVVDAIPLAILVRRSMWVPAVPRPLFDAEGGIRLPKWAMEPSAKALKWWQRAINRAGVWLQSLAPEWVIEEFVPF